MIGKPTTIETTELELTNGETMRIKNLGKYLMIDLGNGKQIRISAGDAHRLMMLINHWMAELPKGRKQ